MKPPIRILSIICAATLLASCDTYNSIRDTVAKATTYETSPETTDRIIVRSEQLEKQALYTFDGFLFIERNNELMLKGVDPSIHLVAEKVRSHGKEWIVAARNATKTFKANRTEANAANVRTAYLALKGLYDETKSAQAQADKLSNKTP